MRRLLNVVLVLVVMTFASCAKVEDESVIEKQKVSFEAWIKLYAPDAVKHESGIYTKVLKASSKADAISPTSGDWVYIDYTAKTMVTGDLYVTRDSLVAKHQGTFQYYTHYAPQYMYFNKTNLTLIKGNYFALEGMKEGETTRVYIPSELAYGVTGVQFSNGYQCQGVVGGNAAVIFDLTLVKVVKDPIAYEVKEVQKYAVDKLGLNVADSLKKDMYLKITSIAKDTMKIQKDSAVSVYYVGRFLDGFVFDTNIQDTAEKYKIGNSDGVYEALTITPNDGAKVVKGFKEALLGMKYGQTATTVFPSSYGYGGEGSGGDRTIIQQYTPLVFEIETAPVAGDGSLKYPYTVAKVQSMTRDTTDVWVEGYIVGVVNGDILVNSQFTGDFTVKTNILISSSRTATNYLNCIPVELSDPFLQERLNLVDNPGKKGVHVKIYGNIGMLFNNMGIIGATDYR